MKVGAYFQQFGEDREDIAKRGEYIASQCDIYVSTF